MTKISYAGYRFPPEIIQQAIWLYLRFTLSLRDVEDLLAERGSAVSYEAIRRWVSYFGPKIAMDLRRRRPKPHTVWHMDEMYLKIGGRMVYLWRAVDGEGEVLDVLVQSRRNKQAALKLMRKLLKKYGFVPDKLVTDELRSYTARANIAHRTRLPYSNISSDMATLIKGVDLASNRADGIVHALSNGMSSQLERMQAHGARGTDRADYDGMDQHGADLDNVSRSN